MFSIEGTSPRLVTPEELTRGDFQRIARQLSTAPFRASKTGQVAARCASATQRIETRWNGKESEDVAQPGDYIVTNLSPDGAPLRDREGRTNTYVIRAERFPELYQRGDGTTPHGEVYRARGVVEALYLPGGFDIIAPWGEQQQATSGYLILNGDEVYGNSKQTFEATYARM
jgi:hypothetical protein